MKRMAKAATQSPHSPVKLLAPELIQGDEPPHLLRQKLHQSVDSCFAGVGAEERDYLTSSEFNEVCKASRAWR